MKKTDAVVPEHSQKNSAINLIMEAMKQQPSRAERAGITKEQLEALYILGFKLYQTECYQQAADIFSLLCFYEPRVARNWVALGGANQRIKNNYSAAAAFAMASMYDPLNPEPKFYAAHSFIDLMNLPAALKCALSSLELCHSRNDRNDLLPRVKALCDALINQLTTNS